LYDDHVDAVHAMIARRIGPSAAPAVTGEAFEHALRTWERFDVERGTERLFLYGAASAALRHHAADEAEHIRTLRTDAAPIASIDDPLVGVVRARRRNTVDADESTPIDATDDDDSPARRMLRAIADLAPDDRDIVLLSLWESCPQGAIAEALDLPIGTVRSALGRIRRELKIAAAGTTA